MIGWEVFEASVARLGCKLGCRAALLVAGISTLWKECIGSASKNSWATMNGILSEAGAPGVSSLGRKNTSLGVETALTLRYGAEGFRPNYWDTRVLAHAVVTHL